MNEQGFNQPTTLNNNPAQPITVLPSNNIPPKSNLPFVLIVIVVSLIAGIGGIFLGKNLNTSKTAVPTVTVPTIIVIKPTVAPTVGQTVIPTVDPIANWKTYTNTTYGFEFKYPDSLMNLSIKSPSTYSPETLYYIDLSSKETREFSNLSPTGTFSTTPIYSLLIYIDNNKYKSEEEFFGLGKRLFGGDAVVVDLFGKKSLKTSGHPGLCNKGAYYIIYKNYYFTFQRGNCGQDVQKGEELLDQIFSTFKFTE